MKTISFLQKHRINKIGIVLLYVGSRYLCTILGYTSIQYLFREFKDKNTVNKCFKNMICLHTFIYSML